MSFCGKILYIDYKIEDVGWSIILQFIMTCLPFFLFITAIIGSVAGLTVLVLVCCCCILCIGYRSKKLKNDRHQINRTRNGRYNSSPHTTSTIQPVRAPVVVLTPVHVNGPTINSSSGVHAVINYYPQSVMQEEPPPDYFSAINNEAYKLDNETSYDPPAYSSELVVSPD